MSRAATWSAAVVGVVLVGLTAACTSGTAGDSADRTSASGGKSVASSDSSSLPAPTSSAPSASSSSSTPPSSTPPAASSTPSRHSGTPSRITVNAPASVTPRSTCQALTVRVIRGSADRGREFAALQFTNDSTTSCTLYGYPSVTLLRAGRQIGTASQPATTADSRFDLAAGDTAESKLNDFTDCQGSLSDTVRVVVPGSSQTASRPGELRACTLRVSALGRPD